MLAEFITAKNLRSLAGGRSYSRGEDYFESGQVGPVSEKNDVISAKVHGSHTYEVRLKIVPAEKGKFRLDHTCTCPVGRDGDFCKHCVALGLAWIEKAVTAASDELPSAKKGSKKAPTLNDVRKWLEDQDRGVLLDMLMEQVQRDGHLQETLLLKIARENARGIDMTAYRAGIRSAFHTGGFVDYYETGDYAAGVDEEIAKVERLLKEGFAEETISLCEYALERANMAINDVDDSDGHFWHIAESFQSLHLAACKKAKPDPVKLAKRFFAIEMGGGDLDIFSGAADTYKGVLGKEGLAEYRRLAESAWAKVPEKKPASDGSSRFGSSPPIARIMESLARAEGNVDELIAIKKRDLSHPYRFLEIAEICRNAKRHDEALEWAEQGLSSFRTEPDNRLRDFLAEEYHRCKKHEEAYGLYRFQFVERSHLEYYKKFIGYAKKVKREGEARDEALSWLRGEIEKEKKAPRQHYWYGKPDHSRLVEIFLWEKDPEAAWKEARKGGCRDELWLKLAQLREKEHPADAVAVYQRLVEPVIDRKKNDAYEEAVGMIGKVQELMDRQGKGKEFAAYLADVRLRHKPKRNLMKLLERF